SADNLDADGLELLLLLFGLFELLRGVACRNALQLVDACQVARGSRDSQSARQQVVPGEAGAHAYRFTSGAQILDILLQDDFDGACHETSYSLDVNGSSAMLRARSMASVICRSCLAQLPDPRRGTILPRSVTKYLSACGSL